ncbi:DNA polymerase zeta catalytic subunit [Geranomyces variabilis]|nr:DNA polymerase zeta catalytic subunit [Geranomyces variabilis]
MQLPQPQPQPLQPQAQQQQQQEQPRDDPFVSVRIVSMDHYMTYPNPLLDHTATQFSAPGTRGFKVPVVRIFGVTGLGQKACVHLHNAYRYFYIPYEGPSDPAQARIYIHKLGTSLNHATALAYGKDRDDAGKNLYIASIGLVKGIPFYGVHPAYRPFLKVNILNPNQAKKIVTILQSGTVLGTCFQPYEAHLSYLHQLFIDYDLYGMDFIHFYQARFRLPILEVPRTEPVADTTVPVTTSPSSIPARFFSEDTLPDRYKWPPRSRVRRQSYCEIELDAWVGDVMNRARVKERPMVALPGGSSGLDGTKLIPSLQSIWKDEQERRNRAGIIKPLSDSGTQLSARDDYSSWSNEARLRAELDASIRRNISRVPRSSTFDDRALEYLPTTFQSVPCWRPRAEVSKGGGTANAVPAGEAANADNAAETMEADYTAQDQIPSVLSGVDRDSTDGTQTNLVSPQPRKRRRLENFASTEVDAALSPLLLEPRPDAQAPPLSLSEAPMPVGHHEQPHTPFPAPLNGAEEIDTAASSPSHIDFQDLEAHTPYNPALARPSIAAGNDSADWTFSARPPRSVETFADASVPTAQFPASLLTGLGIPSEQQVRSEPTSEDDIKSAELETTVVPGIDNSSGGSGPPRADFVHISLSSSANSSEERAMVAAAAAAAAPAASSSRLIRPARAPPSTDELLAMLKDYRIPRVIYREPFYSDPKDVPARAKTYGTREFKLQADDPALLPEFKPALPESEDRVQPRQEIKGLAHWRHVKFDEGVRTSIKVWRPGISPPTRQEVEKWLKEQKSTAVPRSVPKTTRAHDQNDAAAARKPEIVSQLEAPTPKNAYGFKYDQISAKAVTQEKQFVSILSMELHAASQGDLLPNPQSDPIRCLFYCLKQDDHLRFPSNGHRSDYFVGIVMVADEHPLSKTGVTSCSIDIVADEKSLVELFLTMVRGFDPDFLAGFEIHNSSWGYLIERARYAHSIDMLAELARVRPEDVNTKFGAEEDAWGSRKQSHLSTTGRNFLNVWRLLRNEVNLTSYTLESVAYHILHIRVPKFSSRSLAEWYDGPHRETRMLFRWRTIAYYLARTQHVMSLIEDTETVSRTSEFARVFGIDFMSVLTRGSQYKVESIMARIAKPENYVLLAPSGKQVFNQRACECLPLVMEPDSRFYTSPLLVLDFQSLYPSIMIAYNYCYSTCLGRVQNVGAPGKLGVLDDYEVSAEFVEQYKDLINVSPNGVAFLKKEVRMGTLRRMLTEILDTRVMVKQSMKLYKTDKALLRILEARQLGLKFIANVTYGYTGASFSGRMPCAEIADAIVQTGRATLEKGITIIHGNPKWGARVVYGDTDSLFVHLPGATKDGAFRIGREIVNAITRTNPEPVKLKFEKVYHPCVLLAKKRYVGFKYESPEDVEPVFDAKGIETVRRDGCPAVAKEMEQCLKMLFRSQDMSEVKRHCHRQWSKILTGRVSVQDFIKATEVKLGSYTVPPPGALVAMRKMAADPRAEPQIGERVPYVVVHGGPNYKLKDSVVPPEELLFSRNLRLHGQYYVERMIIPAISRVFNLVGVDLLSWYRDMPKVIAATRFTASQLMQEQNDTRGPAATLLAGRTIDQYYVARHCVVCHALVAKPGRGGGAGDGGGNGGGDTTLCASCRADKPTTAATLAMRSSAAQRAHAQIQSVCRSCTGHATALDADSACISLDCPVFFARLKANEAARLAERWEKSCARLEW